MEIVDLKQSYVEFLDDVIAADLEAVKGGDSGFQVVTGGNSATTGINIGGGRIENKTDSTFVLTGGEGSPVINISVVATANSRSFPQSA